MASVRSASVSLPPSTERYSVERRVGGGAMGEIFRALDRVTGEVVALKMLRPSVTPDAVARFRREVAVLADLRHPNIVRYIDHGVWPSGRPYLVMEWLEGEDLAVRTRRDPPGMADAVEAVRRASAALAAVHARGVVHRDIKLANLWLSEGRIQRVKLIDFGVVKPAEDDGFTTQPGAIVGTPHHMSPEQARNEAVTPRSDVYALGSVLFLLVTGRVVFPTEHLVALLGRLVLEEPPRASSVRPDVPEALDALIDRCLRREPSERYADGGELSRALARVGELPLEPPGAAPSVTRPPTRPASVSGASAPAAPARPPTLRPALGEGSKRIVAVVLASIEQGLLPKDLSRALRLVTRSCDRLEPIRGERLVLVLGLTGSEGDEVLRGARAALLITRLAGGARVALAAGLVNDAERGLSAETFERAAVVLAQAVTGEARIDREAAPLLGSRFRLSEDQRGLLVVGEEEGLGRARQLLGRPTPTVGRTEEFASLATLYLDALADGQPRAALVVGAAGVGKSRLRYELVRWLRAHPEPPDILLCRGDPLSERGGLSSLGRALRGRVGILDGEDPPQQRAKLAPLVAEVRRAGVPAAQAEVFLAELLGVRGLGPEESLGAARQDPSLMVGRLQGVFEALMRADAHRSPQVVVLEDLHWTDDLTRQLIGWALGTAHLRLVVFAFARPGLDEAVLPWRPSLRVELGPLGVADARRLTEDMLPQALPSVREAIVERAGGNALFLEELIRHAAEGHDGLPLTVQALVQARLDAMAPELRSVARAASVFGRACWTEGVEALTQVPSGAALAALSAHELLSENDGTRLAGQQEWIFRHALVREAIYASLLEEDRRVLHERAARWLEVAGEEDLATLAWHVELSGDRARAGDLYARATAQAHAAGHLDSVLALADSGLACTDDALVRGRLLVAKVRALGWLGRYGETLSLAQQALASCERGTSVWAEAARQLASALRDLGRQHESAQVLQEALRSVEGYDEGTLSLLLSEQARTLADLGHTMPARAAVEQAMRLAQQARSGRETAQVRAVDARFFVTAVEGDVGRQIEACLDVVRLADELGDVPLGTRARCNLGHSFNALGRFEEAAETLGRAVADALRSRTLPLQGFALHNLGLTLARTGRFEEAFAHQQSARALAEQMGHERLRTSSLQYEALALAWQGKSLAQAHSLAREAHRAAVQQPTQRLMATRVLAFVQLRRGAHEAALELLGEAGVVPGGAGDHEWGMLARLTQVEAMFAVGDRSDGRALLRRAVIVLLDQFHALPKAYQSSFLDRIDEHSRLVQLARGQGISLRAAPGGGIKRPCSLDSSSRCRSCSPPARRPLTRLRWPRPRPIPATTWRIG